MPAVSEKQQRAMHAAAAGRSTLGIPKSVGEEFVGADKHAAGIVFVAPDGDVLVLRRSAAEPNFGGHWALPGGGANDGETPEAAAMREAREEMGENVPAGALKLVCRTRTPNGFLFSTFAQPVDVKFAPALNDEHSGYAWASLDMLPQPLHPSVASTLGEHIGVAEDMDPEDWEALRTGFVKWTREEEAEADHAADEAPFALERFAFDRRNDGESSVRSVDADGRLHVAISNISKACVNPYLGREIPGWRALGLDPDKIYRLFRDPEELAKGAGTFNNLQMLSEHVPVSADDHKAEKTIGSTGTDAVFEYPYLKNSLVIWSKPAIDAIESGDMKELSSAYRYRADMTPGSFEGQDYDGVMRDIVGNHVAIVKEGRAGSDVVVGDSKEQLLMKSLTVHGVLAASLIGRMILPRLAQDAKLSVSQACLGLDAKNYATVRPKIIEAVKASITGKLKPQFAMDTTIGDVNNLLDKLEGGAEKLEKPDTADEMMTEANSAVPMVEEAVDADPVAKIKEFLASAGVPAEVIAKIDEIAGGAIAGAKDNPPEFAGKPKNPAQDEDKEDDEEEKVSPKAMDAAIKAAVEDANKKQRALRDAERAVRPYIGDVHLACDSADDVYRAAFKTLGVDVKDVHPSAYPTILGLQKKLTEKRRGEPVVALDAATAKGFHDRHPYAKNIERA